MLEWFVNFTSLIIALVSLLVSILALRISKRLYFFASQDYKPEIDYNIEDDRLEIINKSNDLFIIKNVNFLKLQTLGFYDNKKRRVIQITFIINSSSYSKINIKEKEKKLQFSFDTSAPCAYLCPYDNEIIKLLRERIQERYGLGSKKGYAMPSLQSICYLVEIVYRNKFQDADRLFFQYKHLHGYGFEKFKIKENEYEKILATVNIPAFKTIDDLWDFLLEDYLSD